MFHVVKPLCNALSLTGGASLQVWNGPPALTGTSTVQPHYRLSSLVGGTRRETSSRSLNAFKSQPEARTEDAPPQTPKR